MQVRLAFAWPASAPEILRIDEVLAVGDVRVPAQCLGAMKDVAAAGRTVLFSATTWRR
jgi:ABC-type polysaccharide/polyol phosphate transport system ATPase subunit